MIGNDPGVAGRFPWLGRGAYHARPVNQPLGIDVVVVTYRCARLARECLDSISQVQDAPLNVYVVDNASGDGTAEMVRANFPRAELVENDQNLGFAAASNRGIQAGAAPLILILNPDACLEADTLGPLIQVLEERDEVAAVGPKLVRPDGSLDHAAKRSFPTVRGALAYFTGVEKVVRRAEQYTAPDVSEGPVDAISGAFMLIRRSALDEVGLFDEGYWMYMEDLDLCYRLGDAGWQVFYEPRAVAGHIKGGSAGQVRSVRLNAWFHYGMYRFYRKFYAPQRPLLANVVVYAGIATKLVSAVLRGRLIRA